MYIREAVQHKKGGAMQKYLEKIVAGKIGFHTFSFYCRKIARFLVNFSSPISPFSTGFIKVSYTYFPDECGFQEFLIISFYNLIPIFDFGVLVQ